MPHARIVYYNSLPDLAVALQTGKIDAFPSDEIALEMMRGQGSEMTDCDWSSDVCSSDLPVVMYECESWTLKKAER